MKRIHPGRSIPRRAGALAAMAVMLMAAACDDSTGADRRDVTIGGIFSLTGTWSSLGVTSQAAMELAVEDANAQAAGTGITFRADIRDTRLEPTTALSAVQSLREDGVQIIIGPQSSAELAFIKSYVDANPVLVVSQSSTAGSLAVAGDHIFRFTAADSLEGIASAALMYADGVRAVVPVWRVDAGNQGLQMATRRAFIARGGVVSTGTEYGNNPPTFETTASVLRDEIRRLRATRPASEVAVYAAGFDEVARLLEAAAAEPELAEVRWYGADGTAQSTALTSRPAAAAFAQRVGGFPSALFGLDLTARANWEPIATRIRQRAGGDPDAFALAVYDAVRVAALAYLTSRDGVDVDSLAARYAEAAGSYHGATGWAALNAAGDRRYADFDFWAIRPSTSSSPWTRVAGYETRSGTLTR